MKKNIIYRALCYMFLTSFAGCQGLDTIDDISVGESRVVYRVSGVSATKAYLVNTDNVGIYYPEMTVKAVTRKASASRDDVRFTDTFTPSVTESASLHYGWEEDSYVFYSYPSESITPRFMDNAMVFDYTVSDNSTDTDDIIIARTAQTRGNTVTFEYKHIFTAVNIIYKSMKIGHTISKVAVLNTKRTGKCKLGDSGRVYWDNVSDSGDLVDTKVRYATINGTEITEDGTKFMTIPYQPIIIEVVIDGITVRDTCEAKNPGEIVNFYIEDDFKIKKENGSEANGEVIRNPDGTYKMTMETYVTGEYETVVTSKPMDFILVLDFSGSMAKSYSDSKTPSFPAATVTKRSYNDWKANKTKYKATLNGVQYTIQCTDQKNPVSGKDNYHYAYITVGSDRYYITADGGLYRCANQSPTLYDVPVSDEGVRIFPSVGGSAVLWGEAIFTTKTVNKRYLALQAAVSKFIETVQKDAQEHNVKHRICMVGFQNPSFPTFTGQPSGRANYIKSADQDYLRQCYADSVGNQNKQTTGILYPFRDVNVANAAISMKSAISMTWVMGCTAIDYAMYLAKLEMAGCRADAGKTIIVFIDGKPTHAYESIYSDNVIPGYIKAGTAYSDDQVANGAVSFAKDCKDAGAIIFSTGVFSSGDKPQNGFMDALSSNYPHANSITSLGEGSDQGYYKDATSISLTDVFQTIAAATVTSSINIHSDAYVKSVISDAFILPADYIEGSGKVHFYECAQIGYNASNRQIIWSETMTDITDQMECVMDPETRSITLRGFDYGKNYCLCDEVGPYTGKKLVMVFDGLVANEEHIGTGENLAIEYSTGLYNADGTPVSMFQPIYINL